MKTASLVLRSALAVCFAFVMSSASCDLFDKVDDVTFDVELSHTFHVDASSTDPLVYLKKEVLDAADVNSDFNKYKDKIKAINVSSVTYVISNVQTSGIIVTNGTVGYSAQTANTATSAQVASLGIESIDAAMGQTKNLPFNQVALNELSTFLKDDKKINIYFGATLNQVPAEFDVLVVLKASITADAL